MTTDIQKDRAHHHWPWPHFPTHVTIAWHMHVKTKEPGPLGGVRRARPLDPPMPSPIQMSKGTKEIFETFFKLVVC